MPGTDCIGLFFRDLVFSAYGSLNRIEGPAVSCLDHIVMIFYCHPPSSRLPPTLENPLHGVTAVAD